MECRNIQPFVPKAGDSINGQPNDNGPNVNLKSLYNEVKYACMLKYGTAKFLPQHMNSLLAKAWGTFKVSSGNITRDIFV